MTRVATAYPGIYYRERRKGRVYEIHYYDSLGKKRCETVPGGLRDAQRALAAVKERMHRGERVSPSRMTVKELGELYLRTVDVKPRTLVDYGYKVDHWIVPELGHLKVSDCDVLAVEQFISNMKKKGLKAWTIRGCLTPLSGMFELGRKKGLVSMNPVREATKKLPSDQGEMRILDSGEIARLLGAATPTYALLFQVAIFTGLRLGEILNLRWDDIDWQKSQLIVRDSKTDAGRRRVAVPAFLLQAFAVHDSKNGLYKPADTDYVFLTRDGAQMKHRRVGRALEETLKRAGVDHVRFHDLRHTFASILIGEGLDITYVSKQMGHSSPQITLSIYADLFDPERREQEARDALEARFAGVAM